MGRKPKLKERYLTDKLTDTELERVHNIVDEYGKDNKQKLYEIIRNLIHDIRVRDKTELKNKLLDTIKNHQ